jgi:uncharacterized protein YraI
MKIKDTLAARLVAVSVSASLAVTPVLAKSADSLQDLVGARAAGAETDLRSRGYEYIKTTEDGASKLSYWWNGNRNDCVQVRTFDGRYSAISDVSASDCGKKSGNGTAVAAAAIGALAIGALLLSRKDKNKRPEHGYETDWQQVEVYNLESGRLKIFDSPSKNAYVQGQARRGDMLRNYGCDQYQGESWCEVSTLNGRTTGWARDRYLRPTYGDEQYPGYGNESFVEVYGVTDALTIANGPSKNDYTVGRVNSGTRLRKMECRQSQGEPWCRVSTMDRRLQGWARERYLRSTY